MLSQDVDDNEAINKTNGIEAKVTAGTLLFLLCTQVLSLFNLSYIFETNRCINVWRYPLHRIRLHTYERKIWDAAEWLGSK